MILLTKNCFMYKIQWGKGLSGSVTIGGSKNAVLPIIAASLLIKGKVTLNNVPDIGDVGTFCNILGSIGVTTVFKDHSLEIDASELKNATFDLEQMKKIRVSILLLAPLLYRAWKISIPNPGGCNLGQRPIEGHLEWLQNIGYNYNYNGEEILVEWKTHDQDCTVNAGFWVTVTENLLVANVVRKWKTTIALAAIEPHVMNLVDFLRAAGANISIRYDHTIIIEWVEELKTDFEFDVISDYIQSGSYMVMGALCAQESITINNARIEDLYTFIEKMREAWVQIDCDNENDSVVVHRATSINKVKIQTNVFPGFPTDLQSPFAMLMTQAEWISTIHEVLFEWRLGWLVELDKMWADTKLLNPHEADIKWPTQLKWATVTSWDLRAWCAVVIAGLMAKGETTVTNIIYIKRGYENFLENLQSLGADIIEE